MMIQQVLASYKIGDVPSIFVTSLKIFVSLGLKHLAAHAFSLMNLWICHSWQVLDHEMILIIHFLNCFF